VREWSPPPRPASTLPQGGVREPPRARSGVRTHVFTDGRGESLVVHTNETPRAHHFASATWPAGKALAAWLWRERNGAARLCGRHVLEVGAGTGLPGIVAALSGAASVTLTDLVDSAVLAQLRENCQLNGLRVLATSVASATNVGPGGAMSPAAAEQHTPLAVAPGCPVRVEGMHWADLLLDAHLPSTLGDDADCGATAAGARGPEDQVDDSGLAEGGPSQTGREHLSAACPPPLPDLILAADVWYERLHGQSGGEESDGEHGHTPDAQAEGASASQIRGVGDHDDLEAAVACIASHLSIAATHAPPRGAPKARIAPVPQSLVCYVERDEEVTARLATMLARYGLSATRMPRGPARSRVIGDDCAGGGATLEQTRQPAGDHRGLGGPDGEDGRPLALHSTRGSPSGSPPCTNQRARGIVGEGGDTPGGGAHVLGVSTVHRRSGRAEGGTPHPLQHGPQGGHSGVLPDSESACDSSDHDDESSMFGYGSAAALHLLCVTLSAKRAAEVTTHLTASG